VTASESPSQQAFDRQSEALVDRVNSALERLLASICGEDRLCQAMHYAVFNGGKRLRPLLVYASGQLLDIPPDQLDAPACAVELIHCYSLVHDDLPAMDDDDLRRGRPTTHLAFDEALAILAGDALQALAFEHLAASGGPEQAAARLLMIRELTEACGANGMAGGQALDLDMEGTRPDRASVERMFELKTGALIRAAVMMPAAYRPELDREQIRQLRQFAETIGLAFQIRDDLLDIEGNTEQLGKTAGADLAHDKASWPVLFGSDAARERINELKQQADQALTRAGGDTALLAWLAQRLVQRDF